MVTPRLLASCAAVVAVLTLLTRYDIGSGRIIVNPLRVLGCGLTILLVLGCALMRLWQDRHKGVSRVVVYAICLIGSVGAFAYGHLSVWGRTRLPRMSLRHEYWQSIVIAVMFVGVAVIFGAAWALHRAWRRRSASRPAS
jgi:hypothetical protein